MADTSGLHVTQVMCDLLKLLRSQWLSRQQISQHLGLHINTVYRWIDELISQGMLIEQRATSSPTPRGGHYPMLYALSPAWGGAAPQTDATTLPEVQHG